jgi:hypothetical protein
MMNEKSYCISIQKLCQQYQQFDDGRNELDTNTAPGKSRFMVTVTREPSSDFIGRNSLKGIY